MLRNTRSTVRRSMRGFTLIELLMVVSIVSIMVAIGASRFRITELAEVQIAGMQMVQDVDYARTRALASRSLSRVAFEDNSAPSYTGYLDTDGDSTIAQTEAEKQFLHGFGQRLLPTRVLYGRGAVPPIPGDGSNTGITFANARVEFNSRGIPQPLNSAGVVYLRHETKPECVVAVQVSASGNVRLWSYKDGSWK